MSRVFVMEAVMLAVHGQLMLPGRPVEYIIPYASIQELYEMAESPEPIMLTTEDEAHVRDKLKQLIAFFEEPLNAKKIERALQAPWRKSPPLPVGEDVSLTIVNAQDFAEYGESFDPIETELIVAAVKENAPILTDQLEFLERLVDSGIPAGAFDVEDFEFAVEGDFHV